MEASHLRVCDATQQYLNEYKQNNYLPAFPFYLAFLMIFSVENNLFWKDNEMGFIALSKFTESGNIQNDRPYQLIWTQNLDY